MLRSLLLSNLAFAVKAAFAFALTTYLANTLDSTDFATWSVLLSLSLFFTLSDLGVGQYLLRVFIERRGKPGAVAENNRLVGNAVLLFTLVALAFLAVFAAISQISPVLTVLNLRWLLLFYLLVLARSLFIPFLALLSAYELFHLRKSLEAATYAVAFLAVLTGALLGAPVMVLLGIHSTVFLLSGFYASHVCKRKCEIDYDSVVWGTAQLGSLVRSSMAYFINNLSLLVTRGGLVFLASFLLPAAEIGQLSIFFALFYQLVFQFFDILIRTAQPKILSAYGQYLKAEKWFYWLLAGFVAFSMLFGYAMITLIYHSIDFSRESLFLFILVGALEVIYTMFNAKWQMFERMNWLVASMSFLKSSLYLIFIMTTSFFNVEISLSGFVLGLLVINLFVVCLSALMQSRKKYRIFA